VALCRGREEKTVRGSSMVSRLLEGTRSLRAPAYSTVQNYHVLSCSVHPQLPFIFSNLIVPYILSSFTSSTFHPYLLPPLLIGAAENGSRLRARFFLGMKGGDTSQAGDITPEGRVYPSSLSLQLTHHALNHSLTSLLLLTESKAR
jgi:hypothetical protein